MSGQAGIGYQRRFLNPLGKSYVRRLPTCSDTAVSRPPRRTPAENGLAGSDIIQRTNTISIEVDVLDGAMGVIRLLVSRYVICELRARHASTSSASIDIFTSTSHRDCHNTRAINDVNAIHNLRRRTAKGSAVLACRYQGTGGLDLKA
jgi:hypothetical protein